MHDSCRQQALELHVNPSCHTEMTQTDSLIGAAQRCAILDLLGVGLDRAGQEHATTSAFSAMVGRQALHGQL